MLGWVGMCPVTIRYTGRSDLVGLLRCVCRVRHDVWRQRTWGQRCTPSKLSCLHMLWKKLRCFLRSSGGLRAAPKRPCYLYSHSHPAFLPAYWFILNTKTKPSKFGSLEPIYLSSPPKHAFWKAKFLILITFRSLFGNLSLNSTSFSWQSSFNNPYYLQGNDPLAEKNKCNVQGVGKTKAY